MNANCEPGIASNKAECCWTPLSDACERRLMKGECPAGYQKDDKVVCVSFLVIVQLNPLVYQNEMPTIQRMKEEFLFNLTKKALAKK